MERLINQNTRPRSQVWRFLLGMLLCSFVIRGILDYRAGHFDPKGLALAMIVMMVCFGSFFAFVSLGTYGSRTKWYITDAGLKFVTVLRFSCTIPWEKINYMSYLGTSLAIRWEKVSKQIDAGSETIFPERADAEELLATWKKKTGRTDSNSASRL